MKVKSLSRVWLCVTPWTAAYQAPASMECFNIHLHNKSLATGLVSAKNPPVNSVLTEKEILYYFRIEIKTLTTIWKYWQEWVIWK